MDMKCAGCVNAVKNKLQSVNGMSSEPIYYYLSSFVCILSFFVQFIKVFSFIF